MSRSKNRSSLPFLVMTGVGLLLVLVVLLEGLIRFIHGLG